MVHKVLWHVIFYCTFLFCCRHSVALVVSELLYEVDIRVCLDPIVDYDLVPLQVIGVHIACEEKISVLVICPGCS